MSSFQAEGPTPFWKKCSSCKKPIAFEQRYYVCSVSTCNGPRTGYVFCSVPCFEVHLPGARHKDAAAIEMTAPKQTASGSDSALSLRSPERRKIVAAAPNKSSFAVSSSPQEVLVIASRLKDYIQARGEMNTSADVMQILSHHLRTLCDRAIEEARAAGRKTVMERDFDFLKRRSP